MKKSVAVYSLLVLVVSFGVAGVYFLLFPRTTGSDFALAIGYMWLPALVSLFLLRREGRSIKELSPWKKPNRWFFFGWLVFLVVGLANLPVNALFPGSVFTPDMSGFIEQYRELMDPVQFEEMARQASETPWFPFLMMVVQGLAAGLTVNMVAAFGEELGWRGYLYRELEGMGFWRISLYTGALWGFWHAPLIANGHNYPGYPVAGIFLMVLWCILLSPLFTLIRQRAGSVLAASVAHGTLNGVGMISAMYISGGHPLVNGLLGLSGFVTLGLFNLLIFLWLKREKSREQKIPVA